MYTKLFKNWRTVSAGLTISRLSGLVKIAVVAAIIIGVHSGGAAADKKAVAL